MSDRWILNPTAGPGLRCWDGESVVHHQLSNDTHRLAEPVGWILERLGGGTSMSIADIAFGGPYEADDFLPALEALEGLGFVVRC